MDLPPTSPPALLSFVLVLFYVHVALSGPPIPPPRFLPQVAALQASPLFSTRSVSLSRFNYA